MNILAQQLTLSKEEYHMTKNDLADNFRNLALSFKEIEQTTKENKIDLV